MKHMLAMVLFSLALACAKAPANLTPEATLAFRSTQAVKALDALRDVAIAANAQTPPLLAEDVTRRVVLYHRSVVTVIQTTPQGWVPMARQSLDELSTNLSEGDKQLLGPYFALIRAVLSEVTR